MAQTLKLSKLSPAEVNSQRESVPRWNLEGEKIRRSFEFDGFPQAFAFMTAVAIEAQAINHHPDWSNSFSKVEISLTSHDVHGLSDRDFFLAKKIDVYAARFL